MVQRFLQPDHPAIVVAFHLPTVVGWQKLERDFVLQGNSFFQWINRKEGEELCSALGQPGTIFEFFEDPLLF